MSFQEVTRKSAKISNMHLEVPVPYAEGHVLTAAEADALNSHFVDGIRSKVGKSLENVDKETAQRTVEQAAQDYTFGERGGRTSDPVTTQAMDLARGIVRDQLKKKGHNMAEIKDKQISDLARQLLTKNPSIREKARQMVEERENLAESIEL